MITKLLTGAGKFVKLKDIKGYIKNLKNKKNLTDKDKTNISKAESIIEETKGMGGLSPDAMIRMKKGGAVKKRAKKKKARTGIKVRGTKFKGIF